MKTIRDVSGDDHSAVALTQEILVYLSMFFRSEPNLFQDMLRLRIGLIQNVMVAELGRAMANECSGERRAVRCTLSRACLRVAERVWGGRGGGGGVEWGGGGFGTDGGQSVFHL